jgi:hypothetical protein
MAISVRVALCKSFNRRVAMAGGVSMPGFNHRVTPSNNQIHYTAYRT